MEPVVRSNYRKVVKFCSEVMSISKHNWTTTIIMHQNNFCTCQNDCLHGDSRCRSINVSAFLRRAAQRCSYAKLYRVLIITAKTLIIWAQLVSRPVGIMLKISIIILFWISLQVSSLCSFSFFICQWNYDYPCS